MQELSLKNNTLTDLNLFNNQIGSDGATALPGTLRINQALKKVYLSNNNIGDEGVRKLVEALGNNNTTHLNHLDISKNNYSKEVIKDIRKTLDKLYLIADYPTPPSSPRANPMGVNPSSRGARGGDGNSPAR